MTAVAPFLAAVIVLGAAGVAKLVRPDYTARALDQAGIHIGRRGVRAGAVLEIAISLLALGWPGAVSGSLVASAYAAFAGFILVALRRGWAISSCGCFGRPDSRPTSAHAVLNFGAVAASVWWAATAPGRPAHAFVHQPWHGAAVVIVVAVIAGAAYLVWTNPLDLAR